jgi:hypothetical protein
MKKYLLLLLLLCTYARAQNTATLTLTDTNVIQASPNVPGVNISYYTNYDNLDTPKSPTATQNWTFEPMVSGQIMVVNQTFTTTTWGNNNIDDQPFQDYYAGGSFYVIASQQGTNLGCSGTITANDGLVAINSATGSSTVNLAVTSVTAPVSSVATYSGTFTGGASNGLLNYNLIITGATNAGNNGTFVVLSSTATSITVKNANSVAETFTGNASYTLATFVTATGSRYTVGNLFYVFNSSNSNFNGYTKGNVISVSGTTTIVSYSTTAVSGQTAGAAGVLGQIGGPVAEQTYTTTNACPAAFATGDVVQISKKVFPTPAAQWATNSSGVYGYPTGLSSDTTDLCATCGTQSLEMNGLSGATQITFPFDTAPKINVFRLINGAYTLSFDAKLLSGSATGLTGSIVRSGTNGVNCTGLTPTLTTSWAHYTLNCTGPELGLYSGSSHCVAGGDTTQCTNPSTANSNALIEILVNGSDLYLDNVQFTQNSDTNPTFYDQAYVNSLIAARVGSLRNWSNQNGATVDAYIPANDNTALITGTAGSFGGPGGAPYGGANPTQTLPRLLNLGKYIQSQTGLPIKIYATIPISMTPTQASEMIDYLSGGAGTTYGAIRIAQGQTTPWTTVFPSIYLSYGNEAWNGNFANQNLPYRSTAPSDPLYYDYVHSASAIFTAMRANSNFTSNTLLGLDAQTPVEMASASIAVAKPDYLEIQGYWWNNNNEWDNLCGLTTPVATYDSCLWTPPVAQLYTVANGPVFNQPSHTGDPINYYKSVQDYTSYNVCGASGTVACQVTSYETGTGLGGSNNGTLSPQADLDQTNAGAGSAALSAIAFGSRVKAFNVVQNYFAAGGYNNSANNGNTGKYWGWTVDDGGATNNKRSTYWGFSILTNSMIGAEYQCDPSGTGVTISTPYMNWAGVGPGTGAGQNKGTSIVSALPYIWSYCYKNGSNRSIVLINTDTANNWTVSFAGTNVPTGTVTKRDFNPATATLTPTTGTAIDVMNEQYYGTGTAGYTGLTPSQVQTVTTSISAPSSVTLTPFEVVAFDYSTGGTSPAATPTFSPTAGTYTGAQTVTVSSTSAGSIICYNTTGVPATNGAAGCATGTLYSGPVTVSSSETLYAVAGGTGYLDSSVGSAAYVINSAGSGGVAINGTVTVSGNVVLH